MTGAHATLAECAALVGPAHSLAAEALCRYRIGDRLPRLAVRPSDGGEVGRILALAWREGLGVVPWGGGCHQGMGALPDRYDLALDLARLDGIVDYQPADMTVTVGAGTPLAVLDAALRRHGQFFPLDPPRAGTATVGGLLAANLAGPLRCRYGTARDLVLGLSIVHADGSRSTGGGRVVKNATAYDMPKLYLGALGTLGVIVETTLRVYPLPPAEGGEVFALPDCSAAGAVADRILHSPLVPTRLEILDGAAGDGVRTLVTFAGVEEAVHLQRQAVGGMVAAQGGRRVADACPDALRRVAEFPWGENATGGLHVLWRGGVPAADSAAALAAVRAAAGSDCRSASAATVAAGALRGRLAAASPEALRRAVAQTRRALEVLGGYLVLLEAPGALRTALEVWGPPPESLALMRGLRRAFDVRAVVNPGRFLAGLDPDTVPRATPSEP